jgi:hypothetical protein
MCRSCREDMHRIVFSTLVSRVVASTYCRDFTSSHTIRVESGISHVMEQYDRNFKVQQLMGAKMDIATPSSAKHTNGIPPTNKRR